MPNIGGASINYKAVETNRANATKGKPATNQTTVYKDRTFMGYVNSMKGGKSVKSANSKKDGSRVTPAGNKMNVSKSESDGVKIERIAPSKPESNDGKLAKVSKSGKGWIEAVTSDGRVVRREGSRNWRNNNPGNIEYGSFAKSHGAIGSDGRFAVFPSLDTGQQARYDLLFKNPSYSKKSLSSAITKYAPPSENNTASYIKRVADAARISPGTKLESLSEKQRQDMLSAMAGVEGFKVGTEKIVGRDGKTKVASEGPISPATPPLSGGAIPVAPSNPPSAPEQKQSIIRRMIANEPAIAIGSKVAKLFSSPSKENAQSVAQEMTTLIPGVNLAGAISDNGFNLPSLIQGFGSEIGGIPGHAITAGGMALSDNMNQGLSRNFNINPMGKSPSNIANIQSIGSGSDTQGNSFAPVNFGATPQANVTNMRTSEIGDKTGTAVNSGNDSAAPVIGQPSATQEFLQSQGWNIAVIVLSLSLVGFGIYSMLSSTDINLEVSK